MNLKRQSPANCYLARFVQTHKTRGETVLTSLTSQYNAPLRINVNKVLTWRGKRIKCPGMEPKPVTTTLTYKTGIIALAILLILVKARLGHYEKALLAGFNRQLHLCWHRL